MAASTRASTPGTERFPRLDQTPRTPTSVPSISIRHAANGASHLAHLLRPTKPEQTTIPLRSSPAPRSPKQTLSSWNPVPLTGATASADNRRRRQEQHSQHNSPQSSVNPAASALAALMGSTGMSRASDASPTNRVSEPMHAVADKLSLSGSSPAAHSSPLSPRSAGTSDGSGRPSAMTTTAEPTSYVEEPADMTPDPAPIAHGASRNDSDDDGGNKAFTYPGPLPSQRVEEGPSRRMSLPGAAYSQGSPKSSPSAKRHKCPYCATDFTRHHNLKSHLLTHSQEKPYVCGTCQARFRRLHDLKRHGKLHTGERPHTCPKCGRRFARGDALARHNKGPGGCAGRRSSFGGDDDGEDGGDSMDGLEYSNEPDDERDEDESQEAHIRRLSEPSRKRHQAETPHDATRDVYRQHSSTYPPPGGRSSRPDPGIMGPPQAMLPSGAGSPGDRSGVASQSVSYSSQYYQQPTVFSQAGMTESPKPLSPGQPDQHRLSAAEPSGMRHRSPSLTQQFQQQQYGRGMVRNSHPATMIQNHVPSYPPQLPSIAGLAQVAPSSRSHLAPQTVPTAGSSMLQHQQHAVSLPGSTQGSSSSHTHSSGHSMRDILGNEQTDIWAYVRNLEQRFSRLQDEYELRFSRLQEDVITLKSQLYQR